MSEDIQIKLIIVAIIIGVAFIIGGIVYNIIEDKNTCYDVKVVSIDGDVGFYHCEYYYNQKDSYELHLHDKTIVVLMKNFISNIYIMEVKDK